jgi:superfamily II DNA/RNA helicase
MLRTCPPIVVATPGRLWDLITHGAKHLSQLDDLSFFVLDEADRMVQQVRQGQNLRSSWRVPVLFICQYCNALDQ